MQQTSGEGYLVALIGGSVVRSADDLSTPLKLTTASQQLLSLLVSSGPAGLASDRLADELWGEALPASWRPSLRMALSRLRRSLPDGAVPVTGGRAALALPRHLVDVWDLLDLQGGGSHATRSPNLAHLLSSPRVFPGVEVSPLIDEAILRCSAAQRRLIAELVDAGDQPIDRELLASFRVHSEADPFDAELARTVAKGHAAAGLTDQAIQILQGSLDAQRTDLGLEHDADSEAVLEAIKRSAAVTITPPTPVPTVGTPRLPSLLETLSLEDAVGPFSDERLIDSIATLEPGKHRTIIVEGESGAGKTRLLAQAAKAMVQRGIEVVYVPALPVASAPYSSFVAALPELSADHRSLMTDTTRSSGAKRSAFWSAVLQALVQRRRSRPLGLLIDDAQWLDQQERMLVEFLVRSQHDVGAAVVIAGRNEPGSSVWVETKSALMALPHSESLDLGKFDETTMDQFVALHRPELRASDRHRLATQLAEASGGLPGVARRLLDWTGGASQLRVDVGGDHLSKLRGHFEAALTPELLDALACCSVKGMVFSLNDAALLTEQTPERTLEILDELIDGGFVLEQASPGNYRFEHVLHVEALRSVLQRTRRRRLHLLAAASSVSPHERSEHLVAALPLGDRSDVAEALFESARLSAAAGSHAEAVEAIETLQRTCGEDLSIDQRILHASSLARIGKAEQAIAERQRAFDAAFQLRDWEAAFDAVTAGLPEAEIAGREQSRVALALQLLDVADLDEHLRFRLNLLVGRQASMAGDHELAYVALEHLTSTDSTLTEQAAAHLLRRHMRTFESPVERTEILDAIDEAHLEGEDRFVYDLYRAIDHLEAGDIGASSSALERLHARAVRENDPYREWQALLFRSVYAFGQGNWDQHRLDVERAVEHAQKYGVAIGLTARRAQYVMAAWASETIDLLPPLPEVELGGLALLRAGRALVTDALGDVAATNQLIDSVLSDLDGNPEPQFVSCAALLADMVARRRSPVDREYLRGILVPRQGSAVVVGAGLAVLGPVDRYVAFLANDEDERGACLRRAAELSATWGMALWQQVNERDVQRWRARTEADGSSGRR